MQSNKNQTSSRLFKSNGIMFSKLRKYDFKRRNIYLAKLSPKYGQSKIMQRKKNKIIGAMTKVCKVCTRIEAEKRKHCYYGRDQKMLDRIAFESQK